MTPNEYQKLATGGKVMKNKYTKKQIEELYNCKITYEDGFYTAHGLTDENGN